MHRAQRARAVARRQETLAAASFMADTADGTIADPKLKYLGEMTDPEPHRNIFYFFIFVFFLPLNAHGFEHRGQQPSIQGRHLSDIERRASFASCFLDRLPQTRRAGAVTQGAGQVAASACCHGHCATCVQALAAQAEPMA